MISKGEAIVRLKKMGVSVADDQSIITILLPKNVSLSAGIKDVKEKLKSIDYNASFCIRQKTDLQQEDDKLNSVPEMSETIQAQTETGEEIEENPAEEVTEEELKGSLLSMDDDGQFTLGGFGMDF